MREEEKSYLSGLLDGVKPYDNYISGFTIMGKPDENNTLNDVIFYNDLDSWINNINYLNEQIKYYGKKAINLLEDIKEEDFDIRGESYKDVYKETENMMFRISILWDVLAQIFNRIFGMNENIDEIHHHSFFQKYQGRTRKNNNYYSLAKEIFGYFEEEDNLDGVQWKGNFKYCKSLRNNFTHSLNPHILNFNNGNFNNKNRRGMNLPVFPLFELKRLTEDFTKLNYFISKLLNNHVLKNRISIEK